MPTWLVALIVGLGSGVLGTFARIAHERGAELRSRMLDASDDFVTALTRARSELGLAVWPVMHAVAARREGARDEEREAMGEAAFRAANEAFTDADARVPRLTLLFGVESAAAEAARRASQSLGAAVVHLARVRATGGYEEDDGRDIAEIVIECSESEEKCGVELDEFSRAARTAIAWTWKLGARSGLPT